MASNSASYAAGSGSPPTSPASRGYSRRSSIESSAASTSRGADPFANPSTSWYRTTSPTSSTVSGGSPRSFYSAAQASTSTSEAGQHRAQHWHGQSNLHRSTGNDNNPSIFEDDIGDVTITHNQHETPARLMSRDANGKGKARDSSDDYSENGQLYNQHIDAEEGEDETEAPEESQRIEENLRKWAEKEKLRRANTRNRYASPHKPTYSNSSFTIDTGSAVGQLVRRVSTAGRRLSKTRPGQHSRTGSHKLHSMSSKDDIFGDGHRLVEVEEVELQPQASRTSHMARDSVDSFSQNGPLSATSTTFPERAQRAAKTGSRFIEDLEDQDMQNMLPSHGQPQTYAELSSNPATPLASPTKVGTPRSKRKPLLRLADMRSKSGHRSGESTDATPGKSVRPQTFRTSSGQSTPTILSPTTYPISKQYYEETPDDLAAHLVSPTYKSSEYDRQYSLDDELDPFDSERPIGWLEWLFCCGCFGAGVQLDDNDEQAGRTGPE